MTIELDGEYTVRVEVRVIDPGRPENLDGHPDSWTPADPMELEVVGARLVIDDREYEVTLSPAARAVIGGEEWLYEAAADALAEMDR